MIQDLIQGYTWKPFTSLFAGSEGKAILSTISISISLLAKGDDSSAIQIFSIVL